MANCTKRASLVLELTEFEAEVLCALLGGVYMEQDDKLPRPKNNPVFDAVTNIFNELDLNLHDREATYSDLFTGDIKVK